MPLACGLVLPLTFAAAILGGPALHLGLVFGLGTAGSFHALGVAVSTAKPSGAALRSAA